LEQNRSGKEESRCVIEHRHPFDEGSGFFTEERLISGTPCRFVWRNIAFVEIE
jgi:hypothetical protein